MISVVLATHNEEKNIKKCLSSVIEWVDQVVIVDGESTDMTVEVAKEMGATVITTTNKKNFHINKQLAMDEAKGDLILQLDADEIVDQELKEFISKTHQWILEVKKTTQLSKSQRIMNPTELKLPSAWWIKRKNWFLGKFLEKGGQYPDPVIRLYLYGQANLPQKDVHEQMQVLGKVQWAKGHLLHYSNPNFTEYIRKWNTYTGFRADQFVAQELSVSLKNTITLLAIKPILIFLSLFFRHRGYVDGVAGFVFSVMSGIHYPMAYLKFWQNNKKT